jgi:hypothetical protein
MHVAATYIGGPERGRGGSGNAEGALAPRMASAPSGVLLDRGQEALAFSSTFFSSALAAGAGAGLAAS